MALVKSDVKSAGSASDTPTAEKSHTLVLSDLTETEVTIVSAWLGEHPKHFTAVAATKTSISFVIPDEVLPSVHTFAQNGTYASKRDKQHLAAYIGSLAVSGFTIDTHTDADKAFSVGSDASATCRGAIDKAVRAIQNCKCKTNTDTPIAKYALTYLVRVIAGYVK